MTIDEKIALLQAVKAGKQMQEWDSHNKTTGWYVVPASVVCVVSPRFSYRVKPEPETKKRTIRADELPDSFWVRGATISGSGSCNCSLVTGVISHPAKPEALCLGAGDTYTIDWLKDNQCTWSESRKSTHWRSFEIEEEL